MSEPTHLRFELQERVAVLTFTRPETLNSLNFESYRELRRVLRELEGDERVGALVLTGEGRGFCSGGDVNDVIGELFRRDMPGQLEFTRLTSDVIRQMRGLRKPVLAAVNGMAAGAGASLALAADVRLASTEAQMSFLFVKVGLAGAEMGAAWLLPRVVGLGRATELLYFGDAIDAATAERYGLFNRVLPPERLLPEALAWARRLAEGPRFALGLTKELLNAELSQDLHGALEGEARAQAVCMQTHDFLEAYKAFTQKRAPRFTGR